MVWKTFFLIVFWIIFPPFYIQKLRFVMKENVASKIFKQR